MASKSLGPGSLSDWNPGAGSPKPTMPAALLNTEASDNPDCVSGTNELKQFEGNPKKPTGPYGTQGKEF